MVCPKCKSEDVTVQMVTETQLLIKRRGILWWIFVGWWWLPLKWLVLTIPALIVKLFAPRRYKTKAIHKSMCVCQTCGYHWKA